MTADTILLAIGLALTPSLLAVAFMVWWSSGDNAVRHRDDDLGAIDNPTA